ncbi:MAG: TraB/GumN family protein [Opitutales bacterium]|nr:TraB/GumN family protein [Opitutales bacterium]
MAFPGPWRFRRDFPGVGFVRLLIFGFLFGHGVTPVAAWEGPPFLWRMEKGEAEAYLFGTIHLGDPRLRILPPAVNAAFERSQVIYTEIPFDPPSLSEAHRATQAPSGEELRGRLSGDLLLEVEEALAAIDPSLEIVAFADRRMWAFAVELITLEARLRHPFLTALDHQLHQRALWEGREVRALETVEEQLAVFRGMTPADEEDMLRDTLAHLRNARESGVDATDVLISLYLLGDPGALAVQLELWLGEPATEGADFRDALLTRRDVVLAERILAHLAEEPDRVHFFALGVAHLVLERGILSQLKAAGWRVTRVGPE